MSQVQIAISVPSEDCYGNQGRVMASLDIGMDLFGFVTVKAADMLPFVDRRNLEQRNRVALHWSTPAIAGAFATVESIGRVVCEPTFVSLLQRIHDGHEVTETGGSIFGFLTPDANAADMALRALLSEKRDEWTDGIFVEALAYIGSSGLDLGLHNIKPHMSKEQMKDCADDILTSARLYGNIRLDPPDVYNYVYHRTLAASLAASIHGRCS